MSAVRVEWHGGVAEVVFNLAPVNQFSVAFLRSVHAAMSSLPADTRAVLVRSDLARVFAAGGDIPYMAAAPLDEQMRYVRLCQDVYASFEDTRYPTVAAIDGACLGGGLELALGCDIRVAGETARLGLPEVGLGILPGGGAIDRLVRAIGQGAARDLLLTGRSVSGREALAWGLVSRLSPDGQATTVAREIAMRLAQGAPEAISAIKALALSALDGTFAEGLSDEYQTWRRVRATANAQEGLTAFAEKRVPVFEQAQA